MKGNYEDRTRYLLPRRTYTIIRLDGKAFHTYTRGLQKPFCPQLNHDMDKAAFATFSQIQGAEFAYVQSDEVSILLTDFNLPTTSAWFDGNLQKICSVAASIMTAEFNYLRWLRTEDPSTFKLAHFDARVFTIPDPWEVYNYFVWRNKDAIRNSMSALAQAHFSHKELQGKSHTQKFNMLLDKDIDWSTAEGGFRYGRIILRSTVINELGADPAWEFTSLPRALQNIIPRFPLSDVLEKVKPLHLSEQDLADTTHN